MSEQTVSVEMTDDQFAVFRAHQEAHNQAMQSLAAEQMMHAKRCADYAADPKPPIALRDWFAGQALAGILAHYGCDPKDNAKAAYEQADAMLAAREASHD
jgi:hypothetical protein